MCNLSYPEYRAGKILESSLHLNSEEARTIAQSLSNNWGSLISEISEDLQSEACVTLAASLDAHSSDPRVRTDDTVVVDFPLVVFNISGYRIESRFTLTVCVEEKNSKSWTRYTLIPKSSDSVLTSREISDYFTAVEELDNRIGNKVVNYYSETLSKHHAMPNLQSAYAISIRSAVGDDERLDDYYRQTFVRNQVSNLSEDLKNNKDLMKNIIESLDPSLKEPLQSHTVEQVGFCIPRTLENKNTGIVHSDLINAVYTLSFDESAARFVGVGFDQPLSAFDNWQRHSASHLAGQQIASEYGNLF